MVSISSRKTEKGDVRWRSVVRVKGFHSLNATFDTREEAEEWGRLQEHSLRNSKNKTHQRFTLNETFDRYIEEIQPLKTASQKSDEIPHIAFWRQHLGTRFLKDIKQTEIETIADKIYEVYSKRTKKNLTSETRRKYLCTLSFVINTAATKWKWIDNNPVLYVDKHAKQTKKQPRDASNAYKIFLIEWEKKFESVMKQLGINSVSALAYKIKKAKTSMQNITSGDCTLKKAVQVLEELGYKVEFTFVPMSSKSTQEQ